MDPSEGPVGRAEAAVREPVPSASGLRVTLGGSRHPPQYQDAGRTATRSTSLHDSPLSITLSKVKNRDGKGKGLAWVGLVLGLLYTLVSLNYYRHIR